jgi:hypothetical protein
MLKYSTINKLATIVMKIVYPDNFSLDELNDNFLWRYIELHKLIDLLNKEQIYFTRETSLLMLNT